MGYVEDIKKHIKIAALKLRMRKHLLDYQRELSALRYAPDPDAAVRANATKEELNRVMDELAKLDPACPKERL